MGGHPVNAVDTFGNLYGYCCQVVTLLAGTTYITSAGEDPPLDYRVPEPAMHALLGLGIVGLVAVRPRKPH